jgi:hypothetical protein
LTRPRIIRRKWYQKLLEAFSYADKRLRSWHNKAQEQGFGENALRDQPKRPTIFLRDRSQAAFQLPMTSMLIITKNGEDQDGYFDFDLIYENFLESLVADMTVTDEEARQRYDALVNSQKISFEMIVHTEDRSP